MSNRVIMAAGVICWRLMEGEPYILVIHRTKHRDYSIPKGKQDPGETIEETAVRELKEETCLDLELGPYFDKVEYSVDGVPKVVKYWISRISAEQAQAAAGEFKPNKEVNEMFWLPADEARRVFTYKHDRKLVKRFVKNLAGFIEQTQDLAEQQKHTN